MTRKTEFVTMSNDEYVIIRNNDVIMLRIEIICKDDFVITHNNKKQ